MRVEWLRAAVQDLIDEATYLARDNPRAAEEFELNIQEAVENISRFPGIGRPGRVLGTREFVLPPYIIPYRVMKGSAEILRILHGARKWPHRF